MMDRADDEQYEMASCQHCGRTDVPVCPTHKKRLAHGNTPGTCLPCGECGWYPGKPMAMDIVLRNALLEANRNN